MHINSDSISGRRRVVVEAREKNLTDLFVSSPPHDVILLPYRRCGRALKLTRKSSAVRAPQVILKLKPICWHLLTTILAIEVVAWDCREKEPCIRVYTYMYLYNIYKRVRINLFT